MQQKVKANPRLLVPPMSEALEGNFTAQLLDYEFFVLSALGFECWFALPFDYIDSFHDTALHTDALLQLKRCAVCFANDSFRSNIGLFKTAEDIAKVCLLLASQYLKFPVALEVDEETYKSIKEIYDR